MVQQPKCRLKGKNHTSFSFNEASLLTAMDTAGQKVVKMSEPCNAGLGTPATRSSIIEMLIRRKYIEREKICELQNVVVV